MPHSPTDSRGAGSVPPQGGATAHHPLVGFASTKKSPSPLHCGGCTSRRLRACSRRGRLEAPRFVGLSSAREPGGGFALSRYTLARILRGKCAHYPPFTVAASLSGRIPRKQQDKGSKTENTSSLATVTSIFHNALTYCHRFGPAPLRLSARQAVPGPREISCCKLSSRRVRAWHRSASQSSCTPIIVVASHILLFFSPPSKVIERRLKKTRLFLKGGHMAAALVGFGSSRLLGSSWAGLVGRVVLAVARAGRGVAVFWRWRVGVRAFRMSLCGRVLALVCWPWGVACACVGMCALMCCVWPWCGVGCVCYWPVSCWRCSCSGVARWLACLWLVV